MSFLHLISSLFIVLVHLRNSPVKICESIEYWGSPLALLVSSTEGSRASSTGELSFPCQRNNTRCGGIAFFEHNLTIPVNFKEIIQDEKERSDRH